MKPQVKKTIIRKNWMPWGAMILVVSLMSFTGCGNGKDIQKGDKVVTAPESAPEWVGKRPNSGAYYIGIGTCSKVSQPLDYQAVAKKNALNDLASEISVRVQGETFLNTLEVNKNFSEEFISTISTTTDEKIEDFEVAGIWENQKEYWVFYRLNKATYQSAKQEKKNKALSAAYDYYAKGQSAEKERNIPVAFDLYMRGLFSMKEYWNEVNEFRTDSGKVYLDNEMYSSLQRLGSGLSIRPSVTKVVLSSENKYSSDIPVSVYYNGLGVKGITTTYTYARTNYMKPRTALTDDEGKVMVNVSSVSTTEKMNAVDLKINLEPLLASDLDKSIQMGLIKNIRTESKQIPIEVQMPSFFITSEEKVYGQPSNVRTLASAMNSELTKQGMRVIATSGEHNYAVSIESNTTAGGSSQGFTVAFLDVTVKVKSTRTGDIVYQESLSAIKGLQLNADAASIEAYKKGKEKIEQQIVKSIVQSIMN